MFLSEEAKPMNEYVYLWAKWFCKSTSVKHGQKSGNVQAYISCFLASHCSPHEILRFDFALSSVEMLLQGWTQIPTQFSIPELVWTGFVPGSDAQNMWTLWTIL